MCSVLQLYSALYYPIECRLPGSIVQGIFQARILESVVISYSRKSSLPRDWTHFSHISCIAGRFFTTSTIWKIHVYVYIYFLPIRPNSQPTHSCYPSRSPQNWGRQMIYTWATWHLSGVKCYVNTTKDPFLLGSYKHFERILSLGVWLINVPAIFPLTRTCFVCVCVCVCVCVWLANWLFAIPWSVPYQASLSSIISESFLRFMPIESVMLPNHLILCHTLSLLSSIFPSISILFFFFYSNEWTLCFRWSKCYSFSISPPSEYLGLVSFRIDWFDVLSAQRTLKDLQHHNLKAKIL